jgi:hypothetical protein
VIALLFRGARKRQSGSDLFAFATLSPCDTFRARHANAGSGLFFSSFCGCS